MILLCIRDTCTKMRSAKVAQVILSEFILTKFPHGAANSYTFRLGDLPKLNLQVDCGTDFKALRPKWSAYFNPSSLDGQPAAKQVQALTLCFSRETVTIVDNLGPNVLINVDIIITAYVQRQINETVERHIFRH